MSLQKQYANILGDWQDDSELGQKIPNSGGGVPCRDGKLKTIEAFQSI